jgi:prepilin-type N-terminal cleavage/methylation domain-containing protein
MAKTNNKGFTLIEIVIAVAILSILLTPILKQFANTLETSRKAKALQQANETAVYEMEEFQTVTKEELDDKYGDPTVHTDMVVRLLDTDGTEITSTLKYSAYEYKLDDRKIGAKQDVYSNVVVLDDLSNKIRAYGGESATKHYKVAYNLTDADLGKFGTGFTLTNEGSIVEYNDAGFVTAIVCTDKNANGTPVSYVENPNEVNLGNMHNLDKNAVALVMGGTSSFDSEAFSALFSKAMDHLRELDYESWQQALLNVDNESILSQDSMNNSKRLIKIYADKAVDSTTGKDCYIVKVDVYYDYNYSLVVKGEKKSDFHDMVSFTVFSQKFFTKEPPEIYFEYQPYCISGANSKNAIYQTNDYILFDNYVDECKVYLYKPYKDQQNYDANIDNYYKMVDTDGDGTPDSKEEYYTYYTDKAKTQKVKIHLASKNSNTALSLDSDGNVLDTDAMDRVYVFTNLDVNGYEEGSADAQFVSDAFGGTFDYVKGEKESRSSVEDAMAAKYLKYELGQKYTTNTKQNDGSVTNGSMKVLYTLSEDTREAERLYTVTVKLTPDKENLNTVRLSGAKGAN